MADAFFDPYHKWLAIAPEERPANHYRLLGVKLFESDPDVIESAAYRQMAHVHKHKTGKYSAHSQKLLNELAAARVCLLNPQQRAAYDAQLRAQLAERAPPASPTEPRPVPIPITVLRKVTSAKTSPWRSRPSTALIAAISAGICVVLLAIYLSGSKGRISSQRAGQQQQLPSPEPSIEKSPLPANANEERVISEPAAPPPGDSSPSWAQGAVLALSMEPSTTFERDGNPMLRDLSFSGNDAHLHDAAPAPGKVHQALEFTTAQDFLECPDTASLNPEALSIAVWVNGGDWTSRTTAENVVVSKQDWARKGAPRGYELRIGGRAGRASFNLGGNAWQEVVAGGLKDGQWYFLAANYDGQTQRLFVDGTEKANKSLSVPIEHSPYPLNVGRGPYAKDRHFVGAIDELALWSRALTATEVKQLYDFSNAGQSYCEVISSDAAKLNRRGRSATRLP
jgi:hypothetical protein